MVNLIRRQVQIWLVMGRMGYLWYKLLTMDTWIMASQASLRPLGGGGEACRGWFENQTFFQGRFGFPHVRTPLIACLVSVTRSRLFTERLADVRAGPTAEGLVCVPGFCSCGNSVNAVHSSLMHVTVYLRCTVYAPKTSLQAIFRAYLCPPRLRIFPTV